MAANERSTDRGDGRKKAIQMAVSTIEKQFGKGAILTMNEDAINREVGAFSSGSVSLDLALGIGGYPRGRVVEIFGPEASGKTTLTLHAVAEVQKTGGVAAFIDAEQSCWSLSPTRGSKPWRSPTCCSAPAPSTWW
jgi:recombination protein RecA